jgi:ubiquinone/menaquinone biosynthesis C-methylase UbiE
MGIWRDHIVPRIVDKTCARADFREPRRRTLAGLRGDVIEIGFGSGLNLGHYPDTVERVMAVEPSAVARHLAATRVAASAIPVDYVGLDGPLLALPDDCGDAVVTTFTLCTVPDVGHTLRELTRVLRPGGELRFLEHGLSPDPNVAAWQHRLTPLQKRLVGGCHFDRPIAELIQAAGFELVELANFYLPGPKTPSYMYQGVARPG